MMQDKEMVNDALSMVKSSLTTYSSVISECANLQLRSTVQQIRDNCEKSQYELFQLAESKGFYQPAMMADAQDVQQVKSQLGS
ncbi:MAG: spore coat protein [Paenibacillaceae bacterium]|uniref:Spore coat protein n=1 Tax=Paenibacillus mellifer TaxID=2937794 RepID=A0A9X2BN24_9BACL|nr:spore coat protein [Paenibacillus mellifer]MBW4840053.1 spore coat protein [Paenibacillaceae bacterium]MCK8485583.1 spore coat protein [Paenibacillus mellifer]